MHAKVVSGFLELEQIAKNERKIAVICRSRHKIANLARNYLTCFACTRAMYIVFNVQSLSSQYNENVPKLKASLTVFSSVRLFDWI